MQNTQAAKNEKRTGSRLRGFMEMKHTFLWTLGLFLLVWAFSSIDQYCGLGKSMYIDSEDKEFVLSNAPIAAQDSIVDTQVGEIDRQIEELERMKRGYEARALRHDDQAQRLQFEDRAVLETRRHNELAEENRMKAARVQEEINRLQGEKQKLLKSHADMSPYQQPDPLGLNI